SRDTVLAAGATAPDITIGVDVDPDLLGTVRNTALALSPTQDPDLSNNADEADPTVEAAADLAGTKDGPASATAAGNATHTLSLENNGPSSGGGVTVTDELSPGTTLVSADGSGWDCTAVSGSVVSCSRTSNAPVPPGPLPDITVVVAVDPGVTGPEPLVDVAR